MSVLKPVLFQLFFKIFQVFYTYNDTVLRFCIAPEIVIERKLIPVPFFNHISNRGRPGIEMVPPRSRILYEKLYIYIHL